MSSVLVTGGNGFVGRHMVSALQDRGDMVRVLALPGEDTHRLGQRGIEVCRGDAVIRRPSRPPWTGWMPCCILRR